MGCGSGKKADGSWMVGLGCSVRMQLPNGIVVKLNNKFVELSEVTTDFVNEKLHARLDSDVMRSTFGANGVVSRLVYHRMDEFEDALRCALVPFVSPGLYEGSASSEVERASANGGL